MNSFSFFSLMFAYILLLAYFFDPNVTGSIFLECIIFINFSQFFLPTDLT